MSDQAVGVKLSELPHPPASKRIAARCHISCAQVSNTMFTVKLLVPLLPRAEPCSTRIAACLARNACTAFKRDITIENAAWFAAPILAYGVECICAGQFVEKEHHA